MIRPKYYPQTILSEAAIRLVIARENKEKLSSFGVNSDYLNNLEIKLDKAKEIQNYDITISNQKQLTSEKDKALTDCYEWGLGLKLRVNLAFKKGEETYDTFPSELLIKALRSARKMIPLFETLLRIAEKNKDKLSKLGLTQDVIQQGKGLHDRLTQTVYEQENYKIENKNITIERNKKYNELYDIINNINKVGRLVFKHEPAMKILFKSPWKRKNYIKNQNKEGKEVGEDGIEIM